LPEGENAPPQQTPKERELQGRLGAKACKDLDRKAQRGGTIGEGCVCEKLTKGGGKRNERIQKGGIQKSGDGGGISLKKLMRGKDHYINRCQSRIEGVIGGGKDQGVSQTPASQKGKAN